MYAIIDDNGKQYKVTSGETILIDRPKYEGDKNISFDRVLLVAGEGTPKVGTPVVDGASVTAEVLGPVKGKKITIQKYKRRKGYHLKQGHRQKYLQVKITGINA